MEKVKFSKRILALTLVLSMMLSMTFTIFAGEDKTLNEIIEEAENGTTITLDKNYVENIVIPENKEITINLAGFNIESTSDAAKDTVYIKNGANLIISGSGKIINKSKGGSCIFNSGNVTIQNATIEKTDKSFYNITNHGIMTINGGVVINETEYDGTSHASLVDNGYSNYGSGKERTGYIDGTNVASPKLTINGGEFNGGLNTIKNDDAGILEINEGTFKNNIQVSVLNWNKATINGGTFEVPKGNDKTTICNAKTVGVEYNAGELTVNGGTFNAEYFVESNNAYGNSVKGDTTTITGGTFNTTLGVVRPVRESGDYTVVISGGTFKVEPEDYLIDETVTKTEKDGVWVIGEVEEPVNEDPSGDVSGDVIGNQNTEPSGETSGEVSGDQNTEPSGETSGEVSGNQNTEPSGETSGEQSGDQNTEPSGETSGEQSGDNNSSSGSGHSSSGNKDKDDKEKEDEKETTEKMKFSDVKEDSWFYDSVKNLYNKGIIKGTSKDEFSPDMKLTRGMLVTMIHRLEKEEKSTKKISFKDVKEGSYYYDAIAWAAEKEIVLGYSADTFGAEDEITREQVALILYRYQKYLNKDTKVKGLELKFDDGKEVSKEAKDAMEWAVVKEIIKGRSESILAPKEKATRAEVAVMIERLGKIN